MLHNVKKKIFGVIDQVTNKMHKVFKTVVSSVKSVFGDDDEEKHEGIRSFLKLFSFWEDIATAKCERILNCPKS